MRKNVAGTPEKPRLCVFRSLNHMYAQVLDDSVGHTLVSASTLDGKISGETAGKNKVEAARLVGMLIAQRALEQGVNTVVFDRAGYKYHGRVKAVVEAAREAGLVV